MATLDNRYLINGLVDTANDALTNLQAITNSCNTWLSYDGLVGKWSVVINRPGDAELTFDDSNILGAINLSTTDLSGFYNSVEVRFHNIDLRDREDYVLLETPANQRLPNEPDNRLIINAPLVNNQIQAQLLGLIELKQSRLDKVIQFESDYSYLNVEAGTIISVTNSVYGWTNKLFRILQVSESQESDVIRVNITAQEYSADVYDDSDLYQYFRETSDGLIELDPLVDVSPVTASTAVVDENGDSLLGLLGANALLALIKKLMEDNDSSPQSIFSQVFNVFDQETGYDPRDQSGIASQLATIAFTNQQINLRAGNATLAGFAGTSPSSPALEFTFTVDAAGSALQIVTESPYGLCDYEFVSRTGAIETMNNVLLYYPSLIRIFKNNVEISEATVDWQTQSTTTIVTANQAGGSLVGTWKITYTVIPTYDLNMRNPNFTNSPAIFFRNLRAERNTRVFLQAFA